jgi:predicted CXXCH cytochrome family protein
VSRRTRTFLATLLLSFLVLGCASRPPTWPPFVDELAEDAPWYVDVEQFQRSAHGNLTCTQCHPDIVPDQPENPHPDSTRLPQEATVLYDYSHCADCHPQEFSFYEEGVHAEALASPEGIELDVPPPTCGDCHNAHYTSAATRTELLASVSEVCGECHPEALKSYEHNYHGKAALLGYEKTATCADCHGAHTVLALSETDQTVSACRRCHPKATASFADYRIHAEATLNPDPDDPRATDFRILFWVTLFFTVLVVAVLAVFYAHTGLWFLRSLHERLRGKHHG